MTTFINQLSEDLVQRYGKGLRDTCIVFPSKRACAFMQAQLGKTLPKGSWCPAMYAIEDFVAKLHGKTILDPISLTFELFPIYTKHFPNDSFDKYYNWGQQIVADFEEIDQYLLDGPSVFKNLSNLKAIDTTIDSWLNEDGKLSPQQSTYLRFWEALGALYTELRANLRLNGVASPAQALRDVAQQFARQTPAIDWKKIVFAGFNAISPAEELLICSLMKWNLADCYWDLDRWYTDDEKQEAGAFFRAMRVRWERENPPASWNWIENNLSTAAKLIQITTVPKRVGQAKAAGLLLEELAPIATEESIAVVLPDENLLFPVLHSLPANLKDINVTMGYPLRNTPLFGLVDSVLQLHQNAAKLRPGSQSEPAYYFRDVLSILRHPYVRANAFSRANQIETEIIKDNRIYIAPSYFMKPEEEHLLRFLFTPWTTVPEAIEYLCGLFTRLKAAFEDKQKSGQGQATVEAEILFHFFTLTQKLSDRLGKYLEENELETFRRVYKEVLIGASVPFSGEPLKGIQVMGMLETRTLDFDRLIVLSVNEGILPPRSKQNSLIPYSLRKAFGLPVGEDKDAVYAYHFYRLIQRAKEIHFICDSEPDSLGGGEISRFVVQIEAELAQTNTQIEIKKDTFSLPSPAEPTQPIIVKKPEALLEEIRRRAVERGFSPSGLNTYLNCPLQFYFLQILKIEEKTNAEESMEDNTFGVVLHETMEQLYLPWEGKTIGKEEIAGLAESVDETVERVFIKVTKSANHEYGRNRLLLGVIRDLVRQMLERDMSEAPIAILGLERKIETTLSIPGVIDGIKLRGYIDRIDKVGHQTRVIDYKTGQIGRLTVNNFGDLKEGTPQREVFQLASYAYLYQKAERPEHPVFPGIMAMRNLGAGLQTLQYGPAKTAEFDELSMNEFEGLLVNIFKEMLNADIPFVQTTDELRCAYCPCKVICNRA